MGKMKRERKSTHETAESGRMKRKYCENWQGIDK